MKITNELSCGVSEYSVGEWYYGHKMASLGEERSDK
jgi:hypothetical protein